MTKILYLKNNALYISPNRSIIDDDNYLFLTNKKLCVFFNFLTKHCYICLLTKSSAYG